MVNRQPGKSLQMAEKKASKIRGERDRLKTVVIGIHDVTYGSLTIKLGTGIIYAKVETESGLNRRLLQDQCNLTRRSNNDNIYAEHSEKEADI